MTRDVEDGDFVFGAEWSTIFRMLNEGWGIKDGYAVTPSSGLQVNVASGSHLYPSGGALTNFGHAAQSETHDAESTLPDYRYDLIVIDSAGTSTIVKGTVNQKAPAIPVNRMVLAVVKILNGATVIGSGDIYDARPIMYWRPGRFADSTNSLYTVTTWGQPEKIKLNVGEGLVHKAGTPTQLSMNVKAGSTWNVPVGQSSQGTGIYGNTAYIVAYSIHTNSLTVANNISYTRHKNTTGDQQNLVEWYNANASPVSITVKYIEV